jgi:MYXO-CTERM domain-containing protein
MRFNFEVTAALVPNVGGATVLAAMGLLTGLRRRR